MTENNKDIIDGRKEEENKSITLRDIFDFIVFNWYWFALSAIAFAGIGIVYALSRPDVYRSSAMVLIDEQYNRSSNSDLTGFMPGRMMYRTNSGVEDELLIMGSRSIMERVVAELDANIVYATKSKLRYSYLTAESSPLKLTADTIRYTFNIHIKSIEDADGSFKALLEYRLPGQKTTEKTITGAFGETIRDTVGVFRLERAVATAGYNPKAANSLRIYVRPVRNAAEAYAKALHVAQAQKFSNIVNVSISDHNPQKAAALTNKLIEVYNEDAINSKRRTAEATMRFIDERLQAVEGELSDVDTAIEKFKSDNSAVDIISCLLYTSDAADEL